MDYKNLDYIKSLVEKYAGCINAPDIYQPTYGRSEDGARPHIEVNNNGYHFVVVERGQELERITTHDLDELLFNIFDGITSEMATKFELENRVEHQDFRRIFFKKQKELLGNINKNWKVRKEQEHKNILKVNPYTDKK